MQRGNAFGNAETTPPNGMSPPRQVKAQSAQPNTVPVVGLSLCGPAGTGFAVVTYFSPNIVANWEAVVS